MLFGALILVSSHILSAYYSRARDSTKAQMEVAIKIIRNNEIMHKAGMKVGTHSQKLITYFDAEHLYM